MIECRVQPFVLPSAFFIFHSRSLIGQGGIRTPEGKTQQIYSLSPLTAREPAHTRYLKITRLKDYKIERLQDYKITRLEDLLKRRNLRILQSSNLGIAKAGSGICTRNLRFTKPELYY